MILVATKRIFWALNAPKMDLRLVLRAEPRWGSLQRSPDLLAIGGGGSLTCRPIQKFFPRSSASNFGLSSLRNSPKEKFLPMPLCRSVFNTRGTKSGDGGEVWTLEKTRPLLPR